MLEIYRLGFFDSLSYIKFTFNIYKDYLLQCSNKNIIAIGAKADTIPCGLVLSVYNNEKTLNIKSIYVLDEYRNQNIGKKLIYKLKETVKDTKIKFDIVLSCDKAELLNKFLISCNFEPLKKTMVTYKFSYSNILSNNSFASYNIMFELNKDIKVVQFSDLSEQQINYLKYSNWYPKYLSPFTGITNLNLECSSFAVYDNQIIGWLIALSISKNTILYRSFFVKEEFRKTAVGFNLFCNSIKNHKIHFSQSDAILAIELNNKNVIKFVELYFKKSYQSLEYKYETYLNTNME